MAFAAVWVAPAGRDLRDARQKQSGVPCAPGHRGPNQPLIVYKKRKGDPISRPPQNASKVVEEWLKHELQPQLDNASVMRAVSPAEPCRRRAERGEVTRELSVVERIEEFGAKLDRPALRAVKGDTSEVLEKGEVPLIASRAPDHVPPGVAKAGGPVHADFVHSSKGRRVEVSVSRLLPVVGVPDQVNSNCIPRSGRIAGKSDGKGSPCLEGADAGNLPS